MLTVILRSACCGIAAVVVGMFLGTFAALFVVSYFASKSVAAAGDGEVGWDLVSMAHNMSSGWMLLPLLFFAVGFLIGFRHFSKSLATK